jgi:hypothetical protein
MCENDELIKGRKYYKMKIYFLRECVNTKPFKNYR